MDPVSDLMTFRNTEVERLEKEIKKLKVVIRWLKIGIVTLGIAGILLIWIMLYSGYKAGHNEGTPKLIYQAGLEKTEA